MNIFIQNMFKISTKGAQEKKENNYFGVKNTADSWAYSTAER